MKKAILIFVFLTIALASCTTYPVINPPTMYDLEGNIITIEAQPVQNASAIKNGDHFYILYNQDYFKKYPQDVQLWIFWHEYYHLVLDHESRRYSPFKILQKEADCMALGHMDSPNIRKFIEDKRDVEDVDKYCDFK